MFRASAKSFWGWTLAIAGILFGVLGVLLQLGGMLPPEYNKPIVANLIVIIGLIAAGLGYQDDIDQGREGLIQLIFDFFMKSNYRKLGLVALVSAVRSLLEYEGIPNGLELGLTIFLLLVQIFGLVPAYVVYRIKLQAIRNL